MRRGSEAHDHCYCLSALCRASKVDSPGCNAASETSLMQHDVTRFDLYIVRMYLSGHRSIGHDSYRFEISVNVCFCMIVSYFLVAVNNLMLVYVFMADRCIFVQSLRMPFIAFIQCFSYFTPFLYLPVLIHTSLPLIAFFRFGS